MPCTEHTEAIPGIIFCIRIDMLCHSLYLLLLFIFMCITFSNGRGSFWFLLFILQCADIRAVTRGTLKLWRWIWIMQYWIRTTINVGVSYCLFICHLMCVCVCVGTSQYFIHIFHIIRRNVESLGSSCVCVCVCVWLVCGQFELSY